MRQLPYKMPAAERRKFPALMQKYLEAIGAKVDVDFNGGTDAIGMILNTRYGRLDISIYDDWVAACFDEHLRARAGGGDVSRYSGKWNHHVWDFWPDRKCTAAEFAEVVKDRYLNILPLPEHL